mgnify:CR=1 FL=1
MCIAKKKFFGFFGKKKISSSDISTIGNRRMKNLLNTTDSYTKVTNNHSRNSRIIVTINSSMWWWTFWFVSISFRNVNMCHICEHCSPLLACLMTIRKIEKKENLINMKKKQWTNEWIFTEKQQKWWMQRKNYRSISIENK